MPLRQITFAKLLACVLLLAAAARCGDEPPARQVGRHQPSLVEPVGIKLALIPAGEFDMGSKEDIDKLVKAYPDSKKEYFEDEQPLHRVKITKPFYLGKYEVTVGQFRQFVKAENYKTDAERDGKGGWGYTGDDKHPFEKKPEFTWKYPGFAQRDDYPVVNVSWNDATAFCRWLTRKAGVEYRLPTEAEWEYACRAGTKTRYHSGDDPETVAQVGNITDATFKAKLSELSYVKYGLSARDGYVFTAPVGQFKPNAFGLYDMHGNAWEWCADWYDKDYYKRGDREDPTGPRDGTLRVLRGGSWYSRPRIARSAVRGQDAPGIRGGSYGFRIARTHAP